MFNEFTVKDSFAFAEEILQQGGKLFMNSLDVDSFFTNIPLRETINICTNLLYNDVDVIVGINKSEFENLLSLANQEFYLTIFFTNKRRMWPWDGPYNLLWEMLFCCFMK